MSNPTEEVSKLIGQIKDVKHYENGSYQYERKAHTGDIIRCSGNIYLYKNLISSRFNQLKAKLFNLAETSASNEMQAKAMKGLIKDFCNEQYRSTIQDMNYYIRELGFTIEEWLTDTPLEDGVFKQGE
jgi:hypothetical protein